MKRKTKNRIILFSTLLLIVAVVAVLLLRDNSTIEQNYHIEEPKSITKVIIDDKDGNHLELIKETDSIWKANNSPANMKVVDMLLSTLCTLFLVPDDASRSGCYMLIQKFRY